MIESFPIVGMPTSMGDMARVGLANECLSKINWSSTKTSSSLSLGTQHVSTFPIYSLFGWLVADGWCWFVLREEYCWLVVGG
jgi:hypothetical protein